MTIICSQLHGRCRWVQPQVGSPHKCLRLRPPERKGPKTMDHRSRRASLAAACCAALAALTLGASDATAVAATPRTGTVPIVRTDNGAVRGLAVPGSAVDAFLGLPYAA